MIEMASYCHQGMIAYWVDMVSLDEKKIELYLLALLT